MFHKFISSRTRVCHAPGTQWTILPSPEEPLGRCVNGWSRRRGGARGRSTSRCFWDYGQSGYSCHCSQQWGFPSPHSMVCLPRICPPSHPTVQTWSISASVIHPKTAFTFDVLDHFYMDSMECKTARLSFFQKLRRFTNNAAPASVPV